MKKNKKRRDTMDSKLLDNNLIFTASSSSHVSISIQGVPTGEGVIVHYVTNTANRPKSNGNHIYVWQTTSNEVPWSKDPDGDTAVSSDSSSSDQPVEFAFEQKGYIIGYAVAPTPQAVCSTIFIPAGQQDNPEAWVYNDIDISAPYVGINTVQIKYDGLQSYQPASNKNWVALFQGSNVPYSGDWIKKVDIPGDTYNGYVFIRDVTLLIRTTYSVGYFMVEPTTGRTSLAASTTFTIGATEKTAEKALLGS
jgi:hypothetical protein